MSRDRDHNVFQEWLYLEADGGLTTAERAQLHRHLLSCSRCRREKEELPALFEMLSSDRVEVREGFTEAVMSSLPAAGWESRHPRSWIAAAAILIGLIGLSAMLVGTGGAELPGAGPLLAIAELFRSAATAGAGLLTASWQGLGMAVGESLGGSPLPMIVFAIFVLALDVLFVRFLLRSWSAREHAAQADEAPRRS